MNINKIRITTCIPLMQAEKSVTHSKVQGADGGSDIRVIQDVCP